MDETTVPEISLIGSGSISQYHVPALEAVGLEVKAVASMNPDSSTVEDFARKFDIPETYRGEDWREMVVNDRWDGVVIATHISGTPNALRHSMKTGVPILVEKPVGWTAETIQSIRQDAHDQVLVGYNRRYYRPLREARDFLSDHRPVMATIELPAASGIESFIDMSSHGIDTLRYLFGELDVLDTHTFTHDDNLRGFTSTLESDNDDLITIIGNWEASSNIELNLDYYDTRYQVKPYEKAKLFKDFDVKEPTPEMPVRRYQPRVTEVINLQDEDKQFKPGFYMQALEFKNMITGHPPDGHSATLYDAEKVLQLCESLLPDHLPLEKSQ